jgi:glycosyltransferase involved in cell wall biosynthesis
VALKAARNAGKPFIARCGYLLSEFEERRCGINSIEADRATQLERNVFLNADQIIVTTHAMAASIQERYGLSQGNINVVPNYVETNIFCPLQHDKPPSAKKRLCFIGRLETQKNPLALLEGLKGVEAELLMVGAGSLKAQLQSYAQKNSLDVTFLENLPHRELPDVINSTDVFILPSLYEGHPKTLIEAMSCGMPVIGANSPGIREIISHGENGWLCETSPQGIHNAISTVLSNQHLREALGRNAREYALTHFAFERVLELEIGVYRKVVA